MNRFCMVLGALLFLNVCCCGQKSVDKKYVEKYRERIIALSKNPVEAWKQFFQQSSDIKIGDMIAMESYLSNQKKPEKE